MSLRNPNLDQVWRLIQTAKVEADVGPITAVGEGLAETIIDPGALFLTRGITTLRYEFYVPAVRAGAAVTTIVYTIYDDQGGQSVCKLASFRVNTSGSDMECGTFFFDRYYGNITTPDFVHYSLRGYSNAAAGFTVRGGLALPAQYAPIRANVYQLTNAT